MTATIWTIDEIEHAMNRAGSYWWSRGANSFFGTRVLSTVYQGPGGVYFVTSEKPPYGARAYSVRQYNPETNDINTVGEFCGMAKGYAIRTAKRLAAGPSA